MPTLRLILWPSLITLLISVARFFAETNELVTARSGGALAPLGITWLTFVFGAWFGRQLGRKGQGPKRSPALPFLTLLVIVGGIAWQFGPLRDADTSDATFEQLRRAVLVLVAIACAMATVCAIVWPRLAWTMLCYAILARATVVALTWLAKVFECDTHYTKFGPTGIERDLPETMLSASLAQFGFWVPFTVVAGVTAGALFGKRR
ncbi:MAG: hypothetical protein H6835_09005 [Planctomycetes bacterium]|nr:hypothetical protein [Planctomycetota bacterium]